MIELQLVVNGKEFRSLNDIPDGMRRLVAMQLASLQLSPAQLRGEHRIVINIPKRLLREQEAQRQSGQAHSIPMPGAEPRDAWPQPRQAPPPHEELSDYEPEPLAGSDRFDDRPSYAEPARASQQGPLLGPGDPSPLSKHFLALIAASLAALAFYNSFAR